jgi:glycosyltransferase involved in cell wall biosynthesis
MRVLHVFNEINFSGAEIMYATAAPLFIDSGFELFAISTGNNFGNYIKQFEDAGIKIFHKPFKAESKNPLYIWNYLKGICAFIKEHNIDILHIHRSNIFLYFSICGYITDKKTIMTLHNVFKARKVSWLKHYLRRLIARKFFNLNFQTIGESVYNNERDYFKNQTILVNNWYNSDKFFPATILDEKYAIRENINISKSAFVVISTGSCTAIKNHSDIIKAFKIIADNDEFVYMHLGIGCLEHDEKQLATDLGVEEKVLFLGNKINVRDYLIAADVFVMTSKFEGLSIASIEAMACGLPSILYNSPGLRDLIKNDDNGFLIEQDYNLLAKTILYIKRNPQAGKQKGEQALKYVKSNHFMPVCVAKIIQLYSN